MRRIVGSLLVLLLAWPALPGQARAQEEKEPPSPKARYDALLKDFSTQQRELVTDIQKAQGAERQKLIQKYMGLGRGFAEKFYKVAEADPKGPVAAEALFWVLQFGNGTAVYPKALDRLVENHLESPAMERVCQILGANRTVQAGDTLKLILEKSGNARVKAAAALGLGKRLAAQTDSLGDKIAEANKVAAEAEKYLTLAIDRVGDDNPALKKEAEKELKALRTLRVGKVAPEITATDLDEKEFKLSDYRGKVVLLDFWGHW